MVETEVAAEPSPTVEAGVTDRPRPGRNEYKDPALIAFLRSPSAAEKMMLSALDEAKPPALGQATEIEEEELLGPARGILVALLLVIPLWLGIGFLVRSFLID